LFSSTQFFGNARYLLVGLLLPCGLLIADNEKGRPADVVKPVLVTSSAPILDLSRPYLEKLTTKDKVKETDFVEPYLWASTGIAVNLPAKEAADKVRAFLKKNQIALKGHFSTSAEPTEVSLLSLPPSLLEGKQLSSIKECKSDYCGVKLNAGKEIKALESSSSKVGAYQKILAERLNAYVKNRQLLGYESRASNLTTQKSMLGALKFFALNYADCDKFFGDAFWQNHLVDGCKPVDSFYRQEVLIFGKSDYMQPIFRISEVFEVPIKERQLFVEIHIYTNHFFDASVRMFEVLPIQGAPKPRSAIVVTDVMEIDELKKSGLIRFLYKGKMETAVTEFQAEQLGNFVTN